VLCMHIPSLHLPSFVVFASFAPPETRKKIRKPPMTAIKSNNKWTAEDDELLLSLIPSGNWAYIAETINTVRATVSGFRRTPYECYDRWNLIDDTSKYIIQDNDASSSDCEELSSVLGISNAGSSGGTASSLASGHKVRKELQRKDSKNKIPKFDHAKNRRQANLAEAIRKSAKKREEAARRLRK
jgi:chromatin modification-related protein VID21